MEMLKAFEAARGVGTPPIIRTPDPASTERTIVESNPSNDEKQIARFSIGTLCGASSV